ncbi:hypothetical protein [Knoellia subterranea]|uniref:Uncharacterized protein n=1 Tax=Knoellia subterranea KCTC 19937 TaxID=1385521 RepID=A0A0A0JSE5_9MICO|nr:hypothetical protein [Knoellia subterranea]KGN39624.1 hypothetical protein N803_02820 [Knoellia subterranea KCTC 19937]
MPDFDHFDDARVVRDLLTATPTPDLRYDVNATLRTGHRVRTRRRLAAAGGGVVAAGIVAATLALSGVLPTDDALPSGRNDSQVAGRSSVELLDYRYAVEVQPSADGQVSVTSYSVDAGKRTKLDSWSARRGVVSLAPKDVTDGIRFAVAPARGRTFMAIGPSGLIPALQGVAVPLPDTDLQAVAFQGAANLPPGLSGEVQDVIWTDELGAYDQDGAAVPSVVDPLTGEMTFVDPKTRLFMVQRPNGSSGSDYPEGSTPWAADDMDSRTNDIQVLSGTFAIPTKGGAATDLIVTWNIGDTTPGTPVAPNSGEWTFLRTARSQPPTAPKGAVHPTAVQWTDASGTRHTEPVKMKLG